MVPRRAFVGFAILLAAALTLGSPIPSSPASTYEAAVPSRGAAPDDAAAIRAIGSLWGPQALSAADDGPLAPPPEGAEAGAGLFPDVPAVWPRPVTPPRPWTGTIEASSGHFRAFYSRGPPLRA